MVGMVVIFNFGAWGVQDIEDEYDVAFSNNNKVRTLGL